MEIGVSRTYYYKWFKRFKTYGIVELREMKNPNLKCPIPKVWNCR
jgi:hypothetical protein